MITSIKHWWMGCPAYNIKYKTWTQGLRAGINGTQTRVARCSVCSQDAWFAFGYKQIQPDRLAQSFMDPPDETDRYWAKRDGW